MPNHQRYEIVIFYRPVPTKDNHLVDLSARQHDDICVAEGSFTDIDPLFTDICRSAWRAAEQLKLTPPEEEEA